MTNITNKGNKESKAQRKQRLDLGDDVLTQVSPLKVLSLFLSERVQSKDAFLLEKRELLEVLNTLDASIQNIEKVFERA